MHTVKSFVAVALCLAATLAHAAGIRFIEVPADANGLALKGAMWYPCAAPPSEIDLGEITAKFGFTLREAKDCPISGAKLPLIVVSHGWGGDFIAHHDTAEALADAGFVVAAVDHPRDRAADMSLSTDLSSMVERPTDIKRLIDFTLSASPAAAAIDPQRIGLFGFSLGGYTTLVLIGASPDWVGRGCQGSSTAPICKQILRKGVAVPQMPHDSRIEAAVIADPCCLWFAPDGFAAVTIPVQLWASERASKLGSIPMPSAATVAAADKNLPAKHEYHMVPNSTHFAFIFVCPPLVAKAQPEICTDPPGFDRAAFHKEFNAEVLAFFRANLGGK